MNRNYIGSLLRLLLLVAVAWGCDSKKEAAHNHAEQFTCPMHPQIVRDEPGSCPICGMDLVPQAESGEEVVDSALRPLLKPTNAQVLSEAPTIAPETGTRIVTLSAQGKVAYDTREQAGVASRVAGRIERIGIRYNFQPVRKGQLLLEIYSPDLVAAQRELLYVSRQDDNPALREGARQKLLLLGMSAAQIADIVRTGKPVYRVFVYSPASGYIVDQSVVAAPATAPSAAMAGGGAASSGGGMNGMGGGAASTTAAATAPNVGNAPVLIREGQYVGAGQTVFTIYKASSLVADFYLDASLAREVRRGQKILFQSVAGDAALQTGTIGLVEPAQRGGESFATARVYLRGSKLNPGQLVRAEIPVVTENGYWLPRSALVSLGTGWIVFKAEGDVFTPKRVQTGLSADGMVQVLDDLTGWRVARTSSYLVDSESFIRASANL
ncbi:efflux RND transporter periplasmic adaptor subunit [Persicitalea jodogahamensis]|uniref:RND transporter n=1 Tax=Persicitalea jodogahamensis TaxID=402147 RepID=A0A8J3D8B3_9BACT|nr:efflux RND transporter periplasmic adaptor subunit [Persicitalea jodogahamensis]GHB87651.1 RND transporter [Persicitalea jodogahamensis]